MKKLNSRGLTLVELMAVISILAVIALIVTPNILGSIRKSRQGLYDTQLDNIISAAKNWAADEIERKHCLICVPDAGSTVTETECLKNGGEGCSEASAASGKTLSVYLSEMQDNGYIKEDLENPKTDQPFSRCVEIEITRTTNDFLYKVIVPAAETECSL